MTSASIIFEEDEAHWRDLIGAQLRSLAPVWDNAEDEIWNDV